MIADFVRYIDILISFFRLSDKLDAAGDPLSRVFKDYYAANSESPSEKVKKEFIQKFRYWMMNLDIYGSFLPLSTLTWDMHVTRSLAFEKLSIFRGSIKEMIKENEKLNRELNRKNKSQENIILTTFIVHLSMVEFYLTKIESYMRRKHDRVLRGIESKVESRVES